MSHRSTFAAAVLIAAVSGLMTGNDARAATYSALDVGTLGGINAFTIGSSISNGGSVLNSTGQVVGYSNPTGSINAGYRTSANGASITNIGNLGSAPSSTTPTNSNSINDFGQVAGASYNSAGLQQAFRTSPNAAIDPTTDNLGGFQTGARSVGAGINASGQVTGFGYLVGTGGTFNAFRTTATGGVTGAGIGTISQSTFSGTAPVSAGYAINTSGVVVGVSSVLNAAGTANVNHAFRTTTGTSTLTSDGTAADLGVLTSGTFVGTTSVANGVNAAGRTVGASSGSTGLPRAFRTTTGTSTLTTDGAAADLGYLGAGTLSTAYGINSSGQVVGYASTNAANSIQHAVFADVTGGWIDLNDVTTGLGAFTLTRAYAINDLGQIAAIGTVGTQTHTFLLTINVPEPTSLVAVGSLGGLFLRRRRAAN